jgi:hypothetical protein
MMDRNPYDTSIDWLQQSPIHKQESIYTARQPEAIQTPPVAKKTAPAKQPRMPKQKALELVSSLKKGIVVSSVMSFGVISLLATGHIVGTTTSTTTTKAPITSSSSTTTATSTTSSATATPTSTSSSSSNSSSTSSSSNSSGPSFGTNSSQSSVTSTSVS